MIGPSNLQLDLLDVVQIVQVIPHDWRSERPGDVALDLLVIDLLRVVAVRLGKVVGDRLHVPDLVGLGLGLGLGLWFRHSRSGRPRPRGW